MLTNAIASHQHRPGDPGYDDRDTEVTHATAIEYEYTVNGTPYRARRITIGEHARRFGPGVHPRPLSVRHPVTVYYDPADPNTAVLQHDVPFSV